MLNKSNPTIKRFIQHIKSECKARGVKVDLRPGAYVKIGAIKCSGYFDEQDKKLVVALNQSAALEILVHEFAHFTQWIENCEAWRIGSKNYHKVDEWLSGKNFKNIHRYMAEARDLELDNEKRSVKLIKKFKLPIDTKLYTKKANAYVQFYNWMLTTRRWCKPNNSPSKNEFVLAMCSDKFNMNYNKLSKRLEEAFILSEI